MNEKLELTLFVVDPEKYSTLMAELETALESNFPGKYSLSVVDVLSMPEKAIENQVFATPMLMRTIPEPVQKVLINIANLKDMFITVVGPDNQKILL